MPDPVRERRRLEPATGRCRSGRRASRTGSAVRRRRGCPTSMRPMASRASACACGHPKTRADQVVERGHERVLTSCRAVAGRSDAERGRPRSRSTAPEAWRRRARPGHSDSRAARCPEAASSLGRAGRRHAPTTTAPRRVVASSIPRIETTGTDAVADAMPYQRLRESPSRARAPCADSRCRARPAWPSAHSAAATRP